MANISPITLTQLRERNINYELSPDDLFLITDHNRTARSKKEVSAAVTLQDIVNYINKHLGSDDDNNYTPISYSDTNGKNPGIRYNKITGKWQFSNDGINYINLGESNSEQSGKLSYIILDGNNISYPTKITYEISGNITSIYVTHNFGIQPFIEIYDGAGYNIRPDIISINENEFKILIENEDSPSSINKWTLLISNGLSLGCGGGESDPSYSGPNIDDNSFHSGLLQSYENNTLRVKLDTNIFSEEFIVSSIDGKLLISIDKSKLIKELLDSEEFTLYSIEKLLPSMRDSLSMDEEFISNIEDNVTKKLSDIFTWNKLN